MSILNNNDDDFDKQYIYNLVLKCPDCGLIFKKEHQYVCPACASRKVAQPSKEEFEKYYKDTYDD